MGCYEEYLFDFDLITMYMLLSMGQVWFQALSNDIIREESMNSNMNIGFSFLIKKKSRTLIPLLI